MLAPCFLPSLGVDAVINPTVRMRAPGHREARQIALDGPAGKRESGSHTGAAPAPQGPARQAQTPHGPKAQLDVGSTVRQFARGGGHPQGTLGSVWRRFWVVTAQAGAPPAPTGWGPGVPSNPPWHGPTTRNGPAPNVDGAEAQAGVHTPTGGPARPRGALPLAGRGTAQKPHSQGSRADGVSSLG